MLWTLGGFLHQRISTGVSAGYLQKSHTANHGPTKTGWYKNNTIFSKGAFCSCSFGARVVFGYPFRERTDGGCEEDEDVRGMVGGSSRPFLFLSLGALMSGRRGFVLVHMFLCPYLDCVAPGWCGAFPDVDGHLSLFFFR